MLDLKWIRDNPQLLDYGLQQRGIEDLKAEDILSLDRDNRHLQTQLQDLLSERNTLAKTIGQKKGRGDSSDKEQKRAAELKKTIPELENQQSKTRQKLSHLLEAIPNIPHQDVPVGEDESSNLFLKSWGKPRTFSFKPKAHYELGETLGLMDFSTAARMSGSRFVLLKGVLARMERALASFMLDWHQEKYGFEEVAPPLLVRDQTLYGAGLLPKFSQDAFQTTDQRWLIPTSEVSLTNIVREQILDIETLPKRFVAYTPCFRSESGSAGRDTRGMIRLHQFNKVELVVITTPEHSEAEHERMTDAAESILESLDLPYRRMLLCSGDMGVQSQKTYDLEVWLPSEETYREISSCSNCGSYQARRMDARYKGETGQDTKRGRTDYVHTLNGSGLPVGRTLAAILETYQQEDGSITIPKAIRPYLDGLERIEKPA